ETELGRLDREALVPGRRRTRHMPGRRGRRQEPLRLGAALQRVPGRGTPREGRPLLFQVREDGGGADLQRLAGGGLDGRRFSVVAEAFVYGHPRRDGGVGVLDAQQVDGACGGLVLPELVAARLVAASDSAPDADGDIAAREPVDERRPSGWCAGSPGVPVVE